jgi:pimeloyl-ACP methyl ester carboxylesterase
MSDHPGFILIHGAWHGAATWSKLLPLLRAQGFVAESIDLPGAGKNALWPDHFDDHPSPNAAVTQAERTRAVLALVDDLAAASNGKVVLVGHSLGGLTVSAVTEAAASKIAAAVYLCAFLLPPRVPALSMIQDPIMQDALVPTLLLGDPAKTGALRIDVRSQSDATQRRLKETFYGDVSEADFRALLPFLHCDEPLQVALEPSPVTTARFGRVIRHYIRCRDDRAIPLAGQNAMIERTDRALGSVTHIADLVASHSPFLSQPAALAALLTSLI